MTLRKWTLGMAVAAAALIPLSTANAALVTPNLYNGGGVADTAAPTSPADPMAAKFIGVTTETSAIGSNVVTGGSCIGASCAETTWGVGTVTTVSDTFTNNQSWGNTDKSGGTVGASIAFVLWGIADESVTLTSTATTTTETVLNEGANTTAFGASDGLIHLDLYYMPSTSDPCFQTGCSTNASVGGRLVTASDRTGNGTVTGITNVGTLFAAFTLQPGVDANGDITLSQSVTFQNSTGTVTRNGGSANFYAQCDSSSPAGPGCSQFNLVPETAFGAGSFNPFLISQIFGNIGVASAPGASIFNGTSCLTATCKNSAGWVFSTNDPVNFDPPVPVPEPASLGLLGGALAFLGMAVHRRRKGMSA